MNFTKKWKFKQSNLLLHLHCSSWR